ncbi:MAG: DEAD/DEAH box helicase family protein [Cyanobium sp. ELA712]
MTSPSYELFCRGKAPATAGPPALQPRDWQRQLIQLLRVRLHESDSARRDVLVHAGPGAGKTLGALLGFQRMQREGRLERLVVFCHRSSIARQWLAAALRLGLMIREWDGSPEPGQGGADPDGWLLSYQGAARHRERLLRDLPERLAGEAWLAIADEVHHLGLDPEEPEAMGWGQVFSELTSPARLRLGLSGTPFRADALAFWAARRIRMRESGTIVERIVPDLCVEPHRLIQAGDVRPLEFRFQDGWVEHGRGPAGTERQTPPLSHAARESWRARNLRRAIRPGDGGGIAQRLLIQARGRLEQVRGLHSGAGGLVIARDIHHARQIAEWLREEGEEPVLVHSLDPEASNRLASFRGGIGRWLVSVDMCAEGFDAPRLRVVAYLSTVVTRSRFVQAITRAVRLEDDRMGAEGIPRDPSYVFAPADPLLIAHARTWARSEPYVIRSHAASPAPETGGPGAGGAQTLTALADGAGAVIHLGGPELPAFLAKPARSDYHRPAPGFTTLCQPTPTNAWDAEKVLGLDDQ